MAADAGPHEAELTTWWEAVGSADRNDQYSFSFPQYGVRGMVRERRRRRHARHPHRNLLSRSNANGYTATAR